MSPITFSGSVTRESYLRATRLAMRPSRIAAISIGLVVAVVLYGAIVVPLTTDGDLRPAIPVGIFFLVFAALLWLNPRLGVDRALKTNQLLRAPIEGSAAEDAIRMSTPNSSVVLPWESFYRVKASPDMVLLYQGASLYNLFPREFFVREEDWQTFHSWALSKVPTKVKRRITMMHVLLFWMILFVLVILAYNFLKGE